MLGRPVPIFLVIKHGTASYNIGTRRKEEGGYSAGGDEHAETGDALPGPGDLVVKGERTA